ncbi:MAG: acyltransferase [Ruminococcus sp.]|nr:acyltransferase [Ruminococcus sp.]
MQKQESWADSLKGIAMCGVLMIHSGANSFPGFFGKLGEVGARGVQLFYVISAYLAFVSFSRITENGEKNAGIREIKAWWVRRILRLLPLWYTALLFYLILVPEGEPYWQASRAGISAPNILTHIFLLHGLNPYYINSILGIEWYLADLVLFYLIVPLLYRKITSLKGAVCFLAATVLCVGCIQYGADQLMPQTDTYLFQTYVHTFCILAQLPVFAAGICLYHLRREKGGFEDLCHKKRISYGILSVSTALLVVLIYAMAYLDGLVEYMVFTLCFGGVIVSQMLHKCPLFDNPLLAGIGRNSYPIYLFHYLLLKLYRNYVTFSFHTPWFDWLLRFLGALGISYIIAILAGKAGRYVKCIGKKCR